MEVGGHFWAAPRNLEEGVLEPPRGRTALPQRAYCGGVSNRKPPKQWTDGTSLQAALKWFESPGFTVLAVIVHSFNLWVWLFAPDDVSGELALQVAAVVLVLGTAGLWWLKTRAS